MVPRRAKGVWQLLADKPTSQDRDAGRAPAGGKLAAVIYLGASFLAALGFWLVTTLTGSFTAVARWGGAAWIFLLMTIVLMPVVIPRVKRRQGRQAGDEKSTPA